jgi:hypothetical protein
MLAAGKDQDDAAKTHAMQLASHTHNEAISRCVIINALLTPVCDRETLLCRLKACVMSAKAVEMEFAQHASYQMKVQSPTGLHSCTPSFGG